MPGFKASQAVSATGNPTSSGFSQHVQDLGQGAAALEVEIREVTDEAEILEPQLHANNLLVASIVASSASLTVLRETWIAEDKTVANLFAVERSTLNEVYREFCTVVVARLEEQFLKTIKASEMKQHIRDFEAVYVVPPRGVSTLDGCHFAVSPPKEHAADYYNYKGCGTAVPPLIHCDQAFPLSKSLVKPFPHNAPPTPAQSTFNYYLSRSRIVVENAFGRLKARFRYVMKRTECDTGSVHVTIRACCILHNMCEHFSDVADPTWIAEATSIDQARGQPEHLTSGCTSSGTRVREALVGYFQNW
ncbi:uncharacterized protein LOC135389217 [Ornithodoros turicata]|uniref:uncharacterized protein LOC135389217 n=1 Tax=Ornithodoros turicata TaxID=34597 RepID=UPI003139433D